jgi:putative ABC transport system permease protein
MEKTFYRVLSSVGYEVRVCPRGTLPFATDAVIEESSRVAAAVENDARVDRTLRVLGTTLHVDSIPVFAMGVEGERQSLYRVVEGHDVVSGGNVLLNRTQSRRCMRPSATRCDWAAMHPAQLSPSARARVTGYRHRVDLPGQRTVIMPLATVRPRPARSRHSCW